MALRWALVWALLLVQGDALVSPAVGREMSGFLEPAGKTTSRDPVDFQGHAAADVCSWLG